MQHLNNALTRADKIWLSSLALPSKDFINLTLNSSGSNYTAPANGYFVFTKKTGGSNQYGNFVNNSTGLNMSNQWNSSGGYIRVFLPANKGDQVKCSYDASGELQWFRFIYAKGEV